MLGNVSAVFFLLLSFWVPTRLASIRANPNLLLACWITIAVHHAAAFVNAFIAPLSSSWGDLYMFHSVGAGLLERAQPYGYFLRAVYKVFGVSFWLGEVVSVLVFSLCLLILVEFQRRLYARDPSVSAVLIFGLAPAAVAHTSVTLREVYQAFGLMGALWALLYLRQGGRQGIAFPALFGSLGVLVYMHQALVVFAFFVVLLGVPWALRGQGQAGWVVLIGLFFAVPIAVPRLSQILESDSATLKAMQEGELLEYAAQYRNNVAEARTEYGLEIATDSIPAFLVSGFGVVAMYFVAPLPWQVSSAIDYIAFGENVLRFILLFACFRHYRRGHAEVKSAIMVFLVMTMTLELMWALGTINWGTALRHHIPAFCVLVALSGDFFDRFGQDPELQRLLKRRMRRLGGAP